MNDSIETEKKEEQKIKYDVFGAFMYNREMMDAFVLSFRAFPSDIDKMYTNRVRGAMEQVIKEGLRVRHASVQGISLLVPFHKIDYFFIEKSEDQEDTQ